MKPDPIHEKISRWSLQSVQFLLAHIEDFIEDEQQSLRERARNFVPHTGLDHIESLLETEPSDPRTPVLLLDRLATFFDSGLLIQRGLSDGNWWATDLFSRGQIFHLEVNEHLAANKIVPEIAPLQVQRAPANKTLAVMNLQFLSPRPDADAYLVKPTPNLAYVLVSSLAAPWSADHMAHAHRLINKCFIY